ncbi:MAG: lipid-A-disaccharide synthase, partial [Acidobacteriota bacterium]|nr:lipid-A-disaccharide synthase [Acidobacteriota bacterium]
CGEVMTAEGVEAAAEARAFSMVGITEVAGGLPRAWRAFRRLVKAAASRRPQLAVLIDSPSLNMRLANRLKRLGIPVLYFVSPQIWAWKKWRLRQLRPLVDRMVCIFDFEPEIYRKAGIPAEYSGHPLAETAAASVSRDEFFARAGLDPSIPTVALLPGSRKIELSYILPTLLEAAGQLAKECQFVVAVAPGLSASAIENQIKRNQTCASARICILEHSACDALAWSTIAVVASGTATIEAALLDRPMVVVYRVSPVTAFLARRMVDVPFFSMVNILAGRKIVQELIQRDFTAARLAGEVRKLLGDSEAQARMAEDLRAVKQRLGGGGAIQRLADAVLRMAGRNGSSVIQ